MGKNGHIITLYVSDDEEREKKRRKKEKRFIYEKNNNLFNDYLRLAAILSSLKYKERKKWREPWVMIFFLFFHILSGFTLLFVYNGISFYHVNQNRTIEDFAKLHAYTHTLLNFRDHYIVWYKNTASKLSKTGY